MKSIELKRLADRLHQEWRDRAAARQKILRRGKSSVRARPESGYQCDLSCRHSPRSSGRISSIQGKY